MHFYNFSDTDGNEYCVNLDHVQYIQKIGHKEIVVSIFRDEITLHYHDEETRDAEFNKFKQYLISKI